MTASVGGLRAGTWMPSIPSTACCCADVGWVPAGVVRSLLRVSFWPGSGAERENGESFVAAGAVDAAEAVAEAKGEAKGESDTEAEAEAEAEAEKETEREAVQLLPSSSKRGMASVMPYFSYSWVNIHSQLPSYAWRICGIEAIFSGLRS